MDRHPIQGRGGGRVQKPELRASLLTHLEKLSLNFKVRRV